MNLLSPVAAAARVGVMIAALACAVTSTAVSSDIVISQFYGSGGYTGALFKYDYVELFNRGVAPVDLTGWSIHRKYPMIPEWYKLVDLSGTIGPGRYFLLQLAGSSPGHGADLPPADAFSAGDLPRSSGNVVVYTRSVQFFCQDAALAADRVDYGYSMCPEGAPMAFLAGDMAALRGGDGCVDTDDNLADFSLGAPTPRNSASPPHACSVVGVPRPARQATARLDPPRPDPSAARTEIAYALGRDGPVRLHVFDLRGRRVLTLEDGFRPAGAHRVSWDGRRENGTTAPAGVYFVHFEAPGEGIRDTRRFVRMR